MDTTNQKGVRAEDRRTPGDLLWSAIGAAAAITLALWLVGERGTPFLLASLGGSTIFLFALTEAEAVVLTLVLMVITRTIHPPAGANPLFMVHYYAGFSALYVPVGLGVATLFTIAFFWSRVQPGKHCPVR